MRSLSQACITEYSESPKKPIKLKLRGPIRLKSEIPKTDQHFTRYSQCFFPTEYEIGINLKKPKPIIGSNQIILSKGKCSLVDGKIHFETFQFPKLTLPKIKPLDVKQQIIDWLHQPKSVSPKKRIVFKAIKRSVSNNQKNTASLL